MTGPELRALLAEFELHAPVTMADLKEIFDEVKPKLDAGSTLDVTLGTDRVHVIVNETGPAPQRECVRINP